MMTTISIEVPVSLNIANRVAFRDSVLAEIEKYERVVLDASHCDQLDPLGIGTLLTIRRLCQNAGHEFALHTTKDSQPDVSVRDLHFDRLLNVHHVLADR